MPLVYGPMWFSLIGEYSRVWPCPSDCFQKDSLRINVVPGGIEKHMEQM